MKLSAICYVCLRGLAHQAATLATDDESLRQKAIEQATRILDRDFSYNRISLVVATSIHQAVREVTGNPDPYRAMKEKEMSTARELYQEARLQYKDGLNDYVKLAAAANAIDFFCKPESARKNIMQPVDFAIDDSAQLEDMLKAARKVLYLADNAGEIYFDLPLVNKMRQFAEVSYVVKPSPVQNDATLEDIRRAGLESEFGRIITTDIAAPGVVFSPDSTPFQREFESADLVFAKGMGHYESLSELPPQGRFFCCLRAKCQPVADSIGVPLNSYVAMLR